MTVKRAAARSQATSRQSPATDPAGLKSVRFSEVIKACGEPEAVDLWTAPEENRELMAAVRQNRVLSVEQGSGGADFGVVDFLRERNVSYLIFPKPLTKFADRKVIGIKYELVRSSAPVGPVVKPRARKAPEPRPMRPIRPISTPSPAPALNKAGASPEERDQKPVRKLSEDKPAKTEAEKQKKFRVVFQFTATLHVKIEVEAHSKKEAESLASTHVRQPDLNTAPVTRKIVSVNSLKP